MSTGFKIFFEGKEKVVGVNSNFSKYSDYEDLRKEIIKTSEKPIFKDHFLLTDKDLFIIKFEDSVKIPQLNAIWDSNTYNYFLDKLKTINPQNKLKLFVHKTKQYPTWNPPQYQKILVKSLEESWKSTTDELSEELDTIKLNDAKIGFDINKKQSEEKKIESYKEVHINVICNNCLSNNFLGSRYICCECDNYNLCEYCKNNGQLEHSKEHTFIKVNRPILTDFNEYNNIFRPQKIFEKNKENLFTANFDVVNNGENNLQGCFILPIRYGRNYLKCFKRTITDDFQPGKKQNVAITIQFIENNKEEEDDIKSNKQEIFEGYFRMFTEKGLPFGDIFYVKLINDEQ